MSEDTKTKAAPDPTYAELLAPLTGKQRRFVEEYLVDLCAGAAAQRAGYPKKASYQVGWENLRKPKVRSAIDKGMEQMAQDSLISREWVAEQYKQTYRRASAKGQHAAAKQALDSLAKSLGMFSDDVNVNLTQSSPAKVMMYFPDNGRGPAPEGSSE